MNPTSTPYSLRIATWNLNYASPTAERGEACREKMDEVDADVWILTETRVDFVPSGFHLVGNSGKVPGITQNGWWVTIWVKESLFISSITIPTNDPERTASSAIKLANLPDLLVYGVVLPWHTDPRKGSRDWQKTFQDALALLQQDIKELQAAHLGHVFCAVGDFNQTLLDIPNAYGTNAGREALNQTLNEMELTCYTGGKNDPVNAIAPGHANIDHICLGGSLAKTGSFRANFAWPGTLEGKIISDHYGVAVDVSFE